MRVHHLNCGTMAPFGGRLLDGTGSPFGCARLVCHCLLIETEDGLVLVDTGFGLADVARPKETLPGFFRAGVRPVLQAGETAARQIEALGFAPSDVRHIVLTHLDLDHAGGLRDFPTAQVHVNAAELAAARNPITLNERQRYRAEQWSHHPEWVEHETTGERWHGFEAVRELKGLPPEILLIPLGGHTRGHVGVVVDTGSSDRPRWLVHAGDSYFHRGQVQPRPSCPPGLRAFQFLVQADQTTRLANVARLRELAADPQVTVFCAHDPVELERAAG